MDTEKMYSPREVAEMFNLHVNTVKRIDPKRLPYIRISSRGDRRYRESDLVRFIKIAEVRSGNWTICPYCNEPLDLMSDYVSSALLSGAPVHRDCMIDADDGSL